jgi:predicted DNA-binding transcriptional regulator YafY
VEPCVFEWYVAPTLDFIQQLRTYGSELEILQPQSLREQFKAELKKQLALYK